ncbi:spore coat protein [Wukongibacter sp. M2B1]|uniref:spore coat protein n=1 Tax=Wukongibacter sp. M2B1 TaxID=3088895 RepID=UPI003D797C7D
MDDINKLNDILNTEIVNQMQYNKYFMYIQDPALRQFFMQLRDGKMQHITQLQQEIKKMMSGQ